MFVTKRHDHPRKSTIVIPLLLLLLVAIQTTFGSQVEGFAVVRGTGFAVNGGEEPFCPHGFNAYWLMQWASKKHDAQGRGKVSAALHQAAELGLNVARMWAFGDGGYLPLQLSPGVYDEAMFQGLDFVIAEAKRHGIYLILSLVNSHQDLGGRRQYVEWASQQAGQNLTSDDDFYTNPVVKRYYKHHVKAVLTRINTITGIAYKDEPIIFAWELMNEPRCPSDPSGRTLQGWIREMAAYVKSKDSNHLLEVGLEGFYGESVPGRTRFNPNVHRSGSDFILNHRLSEIDFATIHAYPDQWISESGTQAELSFLRSWIVSHVYDSAALLRIPLVVAEFGRSTSSRGAGGGLGATNSSSIVVRQRDAMYATVYDTVYASMSRSGGGGGGGGACTGVLFWQLLLGKGSMDELRDGYEIVVDESPSTAAIIARHSRNLRMRRSRVLELKRSTALTDSR